MKKNKKKSLLFIPLLSLPIILTPTLVACSNTNKVSDFSLINNDTINKQTQLINDLTISMQQTTSNSTTTATGFVFDSDTNDNSDLRTYYVMTNYHFYQSAFNDIYGNYQNPIKDVQLKLASSLIGKEVSSWNYTVNDFDFRLANAKQNIRSNVGDVYLLNNEYSNYDAVVYEMTVNLNDQNLPNAFKNFDKYKTSLIYDESNLTPEKIKSNIITTGGYPKVGNKFEWNQFSGKDYGSAILMDPYLVNYPEINGLSFNNEIIYPVQGMKMLGGASGSLVLNNLNNALAGIYFGYIGQEDKTYGMYIPFVAKQEYFQISFTKGNDLYYFDVVNINPELVQIQTQTWLPNNIVGYQTNSYTNLVDGSKYQANFTNPNNVDLQTILNLLKNDTNVYVRLARNTKSKQENQFLTKEPILVSEIANKMLESYNNGNSNNIKISFIHNEQNLLKSWVQIKQAHDSSDTFLSNQIKNL